MVAARVSRQAAVELFDTTIQVGSNLISFVRLAAFGLTHAALGAVIWEGTVALWSLGGAGSFVAVLLFTAGNVLAFVLEALVAGVQALRLEYPRAVSRVFQSEGRPFRPWHIPTASLPTPRFEEDHDRLAGSDPRWSLWLWRCRPCFPDRRSALRLVIAANMVLLLAAVAVVVVALTASPLRLVPPCLTWLRRKQQHPTGRRCSVLRSP